MVTIIGTNCGECLIVHLGLERDGSLKLNSTSHKSELRLALLVCFQPSLTFKSVSALGSSSTVLPCVDLILRAREIKQPRRRQPFSLKKQNKSVARASSFWWNMSLTSPLTTRVKRPVAMF